MRSYSKVKIKIKIHIKLLQIIMLEMKSPLGTHFYPRNLTASQEIHRRVVRYKLQAETNRLNRTQISPSQR